MNLALATFLPGLLLISLGIPLALAHGRARVLLNAFPRSVKAAWVCFGSGALWFLWIVWNLSPADFGDSHILLCCVFGIIAGMALKYASDFLAVRGLCVLVLLGAMPLLMAGYMNFDHPQVYFLKVLLYGCIALAIWLAAQPWRLRDFFDWLFSCPARAQRWGFLLLSYGVLLCGVAFSYGPTGK